MSIADTLLVACQLLSGCVGFAQVLDRDKVEDGELPRQLGSVDLCTQLLVLFILFHHFHRVRHVTHLHKHIFKCCHGHSVSKDLQAGKIRVEAGEEFTELARVFLRDL